MQVISVNIGQTASIVVQGRRIATAIVKRAVAGPVVVGPLGLQGDEQADPTVHGGLSKAVYAYGAQHHPFWQTVRAQARAAAWDEVLPAGAMGENLTFDALDESGLWIGDLLRLPGCTLVVIEPRLPCFKFGHAMGFAQAVKLMGQSGFSGAYLAVREPGTVAAGDPVELVPGPREVNLRELFRARMGASR